MTCNIIKSFLTFQYIILSIFFIPQSVDEGECEDKEAVDRQLWHSDQLQWHMVCSLQGSCDMFSSSLSY